LRRYLKQLRVIREEERELMKNVKGWVVGTFYGEPLYKSLPEDAMPHIRENDFFIHRPKKDFRIWADPERLYI